MIDTIIHSVIFLCILFVGYFAYRHFMVLKLQKEKNRAKELDLRMLERNPAHKVSEY